MSKLAYNQFAESVEIIHYQLPSNHAAELLEIIHYQLPSWTGGVPCRQAGRGGGTHL